MKTTLILLSILFVFVGCAQTPPEEVLCWPKDSLLDETLFPDGTVVGDIMSPLPDSTIYSAGRTYYMDRGIANHHIQRNSTVRSTRSKFDSENRGEAFDPASDWTTPSELVNALPTADQQAISCGVTISTPMCKAIAQYDHYFIYFNVHMYPEDIDLAQVANMLTSIDQTMASCLSAAE